MSLKDTHFYVKMLTLNINDVLNTIMVYYEIITSQTNSFMVHEPFNNFLSF